MAKTFFFYDLETSGLNSRFDRVMQFAGIRTDLELNIIGEPYNILVKLNDDILPSPDAVMVTGITPQKTVDEGISEADFARLLSEEIFTPDTITVGFNSIRFDDEFIRHLLWRNFYDPYEWSWKDGRSRWDLLDVVRMTRALRPDGIEWPFDGNGAPTVRLEMMTKVNKLGHSKAHDALSDVEALIDVCKLLRVKQPQIFNYLLKMRDKNEVKKLVNLEYKQPFVYTSGRYDSEYNKTTIAFPLTTGRNGNVIVYDLRYDPAPFLDMPARELSKIVFASYEERQADNYVRLPVKELQYNRAPAIAPLGVLEQGDSWKKIDLDIDTINKHKTALLAVPAFAENIRSVFEGKPEYPHSSDPEGQLYIGFLEDGDKIRVEAVRNATSSELADFHPDFTDERLSPLLLHYKARNYPSSLSRDETVEWEKWRAGKITASLPGFVKSLQRLGKTNDENTLFILQELQLWAESIMPSELEA